MDPIIEFAVALVGFLVLHRLPAWTGMRGPMIARFGRRPYLLAYSAISIAAMAWLLSAAIRAPMIVLWHMHPWLVGLAVIVMPFAAIFLIAGLASPNPLSITLSGRDFDPDRAGIVAVTRHPVLWGFGLWAAVHAVANGDLIAVILFGGLGFFAFAGIKTVERRAIAQLGETEWSALATPTSIVPGAAILSGRARLPLDGRTIVLSVVAVGLYAAFLWVAHDALFGVSPLNWL